MAESVATFPPVAHLLAQYKEKDQRTQQIAADYVKLRGVAKPDSA